jgi:hypothetical protein
MECMNFEQVIFTTCNELTKDLEEKFTFSDKNFSRSEALHFFNAGFCDKNFSRSDVLYVYTAGLITALAAASVDDPIFFDELFIEKYLVQIKKDIKEEKELICKGEKIAENV